MIRRENIFLLQDPMSMKTVWECGDCGAEVAGERARLMLRFSAVLNCTPLTVMQAGAV